MKWKELGKGLWKKAVMAQGGKPGGSAVSRKAGRICLVLVSYLFLMVFLGCFFMTALYYYWFGGETVKTYRKTQRFEEKMMEKLEVMAPAVREYLRKGQYWEENEAVTVYYWKQNGAYLSYTNEDAAEKLGSFGGCRGMNDLTISYDWQEKKFTFSELDSFYTNQWEAMFQKEFREKGTQCYLAVDRNVMQNWISYYGNLSWDLEPGDAKGIRCDYSLAGMKKEDSLCLFYSPGKDQWYYLIQYQENGKTREKQRAFELPKTVYFPLCYVTKRSANGKRILQNISSADFDNAVLFMDATKVFSKNAGVADNGGVILESSPFFNLKSILYEGCKCYYQGRALLSYLENRMDGYLWQVQFHSGNPWKIGRVEAVPKERKWKITVDNDSYYEEDVREEEPASLFGLNEYPYGTNVSLDIRLMIPEYSVRQVLFSEKTPEIRLNFSYFLEKKLFEKGRVKKNRYHGIELGLVSLAVWLFLFVKLAVSAKPSGFKKAVSIEAVAAADGAAAVAAALFCTCGNALPYWLDIAMKCACTLLYFLYYGSIAWIAASIRERSLWKNSLVRQGFHRGKGAWHDIWDRSDAKRKTFLLAFAYIGGSAVLETAGVFSLLLWDQQLIVRYGTDSLWGALFLVSVPVFLFLQVRAVRYVIRNETGKEQILQGLNELLQGNFMPQIDDRRLYGEYKDMALILPKLGGSIQEAVQKSLKNEHMKTELITNVSHDIKTPLTSIINYVDLLKRAEPQGENVAHYLDVLEQKSGRLKHLIEDLVEASKASSGALELEMANLDLTELVMQALGEFEEKLALKGFEVVSNLPESPVIVYADGRRMYRILDNLLQNVYKYALEHTRVYLDLMVEEKRAVLTLRNISAAPLHISEEKLMERFVRGEESRTSEGSGLGLSIARDLVTLQGGEFDLKIDGDLFKVIIGFPAAEAAEMP